MRAAIAVIAGYLVMFVFVFVSFSVAFALMGDDLAFRPGSYDVTPLWIGVSLVLGLVAAVIGGLVCARIAPPGKAPMTLAVLVLVLGVLMAVPTLNAPDPEPRTAGVGSMEAMRAARQPAWVAFLNPFVGAAGVLLGARLRRTRP